jgi:hypothetical protein
MRQGIQRFVLETLASLNHAVGDAWMRGELAVFEEHLYTEHVQVALRTVINAFPRQTGVPKVLLTTFPGEQHGVGLLMVEALLVPEGAQCVSLGVQTSIEDIRARARVRCSRGGAVVLRPFPVRQAGDGLAALRRQLPPKIALWAGGEMTRRVRKALPGVTLISDLSATLGALKAWRHARTELSDRSLSADDNRKKCRALTTLASNRHLWPESNKKWSRNAICDGVSEKSPCSRPLGSA